MEYDSSFETHGQKILTAEAGHSPVTERDEFYHRATESTEKSFSDRINRNACGLGNWGIEELNP
ncbi:MAG: hypothetical protein ABSG35_20735 [Syntrophobacteraceae bacterium]|jgi:hypothetical protein